MTQKEKAAQIAAILETLYPDPPIPLDHRDAYTLLVAVLLSAQCTDVRVNKVTPALFKLGPNPKAMAAVPVALIEDVIRPCGLAPAKARSISKLSEILMAEHGGKVPDTFEALERLPGVGHKTASVVMSQAFGVPAFPVDTHIHRLAWRWGLSRGEKVQSTEADLKALWPENTWNRRHLQMIFLGREHCPARGHVVANCPICSKYGIKTRMAGNPETR